MKTCNIALRKFTSLFTILCLILSLKLPISAAEFGPCYDSQAAVSYAVAHWNDGVGVCDEFVKDCLNAGGVEILAGGVDPLKDALVDAELGSLNQLQISSDGIHAQKSENPNVQAGDILFFYCEECEKSVHTAIIGGYDENDCMYTYGHNPGWDKVDWIGNFTHTLNNGQQHRKCFQYYVVIMDRNNFAHAHNFITGLYETAHPHKMYAECSCNAQYYLGWNATVSFCTVCNPPSSDIPIVTVECDENAITVSWTTVQDAVEYQVWRARSKTGTYFKLFTTMGTQMVNKSITPGETYYYYVRAILSDGTERDSEIASNASNSNDAPKKGVVRVYGSDRYSTAFAAANELKETLGVEKFENIVVACGTDFADALSGSYLANQKNAPILLVKGEREPDIKKYIEENLTPGGTVYLLGGTGAVSKTMEDSLSGFNVKRLGGLNRYETNLAILKEAGVGSKDILVAYGLNFADALSASAVNLPILLVGQSLTDKQREFLDETSGEKIIIGGVGAVNETVEAELEQHGTGIVSRLSGSDRYVTSVKVAERFFPDATYAVVSYGGNFPDGLSGGPVANAIGAPLLLAALWHEDPAANYISNADIKDGYVMGGTGVLSDQVVNKVFGIE